MPLLTSTSSKKFYTIADDKQIVALRKQNKSVEEVSKAIGHSPASVQYRIQRVLSKHDTFDTIKYKGAATPAAK